METYILHIFAVNDAGLGLEVWCHDDASAGLDVCPTVFANDRILYGARIRLTVRLAWWVWCYVKLRRESGEFCLLHCPTLATSFALEEGPTPPSSPTVPSGFARHFSASR